METPKTFEEIMKELVDGLKPSAISLKNTEAGSTIDDLIRSFMSPKEFAQYKFDCTMRKLLGMDWGI